MFCDLLYEQYVHYVYSIHSIPTHTYQGPVLGSSCEPAFLPAHAQVRVTKAELQAWRATPTVEGRPHVQRLALATLGTLRRGGEEDNVHKLLKT